MSELRILMGVIGRPHGVRGLSHVHSYTAAPAALPDYGPFTDNPAPANAGRRFTLEWASAGVARVAEIVDGRDVPMRDRAAAQTLVNVRLYVDRDMLPAPEDADEFYLVDLIGLLAVTTDGVELGKIDTVHDYGAGASLEIGRLIVPFTRACVPVVDIAAGIVTVVPPEEVNVPGADDNGADADSKAAE